jgi:hypothetical protein
VATKLQLNISYHNHILYHVIYIISYLIIYHIIYVIYHIKLYHIKFDKTKISLIHEGQEDCSRMIQIYCVHVPMFKYSLTVRKGKGKDTDALYRPYGP